MADLHERVTALEIAQRYETHARDQDRAAIWAHSHRLRQAEMQINSVLADGARRDRKIGQLVSVAREARMYRDRILVAKAASKYILGAAVLALFLSGKLSQEQLEAIRVWFTGM